MLEDKEKPIQKVHLGIAFLTGLAIGFIFGSRLFQIIAIILIFLIIIALLFPKLLKKIKNYIKNKKVEEYIDLTKL